MKKVYLLFFVSIGETQGGISIHLNFTKVCYCFEKGRQFCQNIWSKLNFPRWPPVWETAVHQAVAGGVFDGIFLCCPFSHKMSWMRSGALLSQFLRDFLPTLSCLTDKTFLEGCLLLQERICFSESIFFLLSRPTKGDKYC